MAAALDVTLTALISGLGKALEMQDKFSLASHTAQTYNYRTLATADAAEALDLGDVSTISLIIIRAIAAIDVDTTYVSAFNAEISLAAGQFAVFKPSGTVYVKNNVALATPAYEYWIVGTT